MTLFTNFLKKHKEYFTVEEFAVLYGYSCSSVKDMCRNKKNRGSVAKLPEEFYALPVKNGFIIKHRHSPIFQEGSKANAIISTFFESLDSFMDFNHEVCPSVSLLIIAIPNFKKFVVYNSFDHLAQSHLIQQHLGGLLIFKIFSKIQLEISSAALSNYAMLIIRWCIVADLSLPLHLIRLNSEFSANVSHDFCLYCGCKVLHKEIYSDRMIYSASYVFCSEQHRNDFDKKNSLINHMSKFIESNNKGFIDSLKSDFYQELNDLVDAIFKRIKELDSTKTYLLTVEKNVKRANHMHRLEVDIFKILSEEKLPSGLRGIFNTGESFMDIVDIEIVTSLLPKDIEECLINLKNDSESLDSDLNKVVFELRGIIMKKIQELTYKGKRKYSERFLKSERVNLFIHLFLNDICRQIIKISE
ncbi:MAG: hypothetical protein ACOYK1_03905 [Vampirovibrionia bacterium]